MYVLTCTTCWFFKNDLFALRLSMSLRKIWRSVPSREVHSNCILSSGIRNPGRSVRPMIVKPSRTRYVKLVAPLSALIVRYRLWSADFSFTTIWEASKNDLLINALCFLPSFPNVTGVKVSSCVVTWNIAIKLSKGNFMIKRIHGSALAGSVRGCICNSMIFECSYEAIGFEIFQSCAKWSWWISVSFIHSSWDLYLWTQWKSWTHMK